MFGQDMEDSLRLNAQTYSRMENWLAFFWI